MNIFIKHTWIYKYWLYWQNNSSHETNISKYHAISTKVIRVDWKLQLKKTWLYRRLGKVLFTQNQCLKVFNNTCTTLIKAKWRQLDHVQDLEKYYLHKINASKRLMIYIQLSHKRQNWMGKASSNSNRTSNVAQDV